MRGKEAGRASSHVDEKVEGVGSFDGLGDVCPLERLALGRLRYQVRSTGELRDEQLAGTREDDRRWEDGKPGLAIDRVE